MLDQVCELRGSACSNDLATVPARPAGSFWLPRATKVDRVARPRSFERQKSTEKAARASPRRDFRRLWVALGAEFRVFRGCYARATRLAARRAEPLFLLAGVVRNRDFAFGEKTENRQTSSKNCSDGPARPSRATKTRFFRSRRRISVEINCLGALPGAPGHSEKAPVFHRDTFWDSPGAPGALPGRIEDAPDRAWELLVRFGVPRDAPERDFGSILGAPESPRGRFSVPWLAFARLALHDWVDRPGETSTRLARHGWLNVAANDSPND